MKSSSYIGGKVSPLDQIYHSKGDLVYSSFLKSGWSSAMHIIDCLISESNCYVMALRNVIFLCVLCHVIIALNL